MNIRVLLSSVALIGLFGTVGSMDFTDECNAHGGTVVNGECKRFSSIQNEINHAVKVEKERKTRIIAEREYQRGVEYIISAN